MKTATIVAYVLAIIGALVWLMVGLFGFNLVTAVFGTGIFSAIIYSIVGLAGLWLIFAWVVRNPFASM